MHNQTLAFSLERVISALCADYKRRAELILSGDMPRRVENELRYLNFKIYDAVCEVVGERLADSFISDIGTSIGYARSRAICLSEGTYKSYKAAAKVNIAKKLYLIG